MEESETGPAVCLRKEQSRLLSQVAELWSLEREQILPRKPNQTKVSFPVWASGHIVHLVAEPRPRVVTRSTRKLLLSQNRPYREQLAAPDCVTSAHGASGLIRRAVHQH